ncbi:MAG: dihydropteroate synthase [Phycisphaerales bacterium]
MAHGRSLTLERPRIVAILNITPDSFVDGGRLIDPGAAAAAAERAEANGAEMLDIGGESTRPGAHCVSEHEQIARVVPAIEAIRRLSSPAARLPISVDTTRLAVARAALDAGADAINDVSAGTDDPGLFSLAAERTAGLVLMHRRAPPRLDKYSDRYSEPPSYDDVVATVREFLRARVAHAIAAGVLASAIVLDPGLGFGKSVEQNLDLVRRTGEILTLGYPVLSAASRKSFVGRVSLRRDSTPDERLAGSLALSIAHLVAGARIFRVHDVAEQVAAIRAACAALALDMARPVT